MVRCEGEAEMVRQRRWTKVIIRGENAGQREAWLITQGR